MRIITAQVTPLPGLLPPEWRMEARGLDDKHLGLILPCAINTISADLNLDAPQRRTKIVPALGLNFSAGRANEQVLLHIEDDGNGRPVLLLKKYGGARVVPDMRFPVSLAYGKPVAVTISWNGRGEISAGAGGKTNRMSLSGAPDAVEFLVQGGKGAITNIRTAWTGPGAATACAKPLR
jgi:hypothetical protein